MITTEELKIPNLILIKNRSVVDDRGSFRKLFSSDDFAEIGLNENIFQINHSCTKKQGTVRGMHFQLKPYCDKKIVTCLRGCVFDVVVDIRQNSDTFLQYHTQKLSSCDNKSLLIPEGFAHGFQALSDDVEMLYFHTALYNKDFESGLNACDPELAIDWPLPVIERSLRDEQHLPLTPEFSGIVV